jgi:hypothetical protein
VDLRGSWWQREGQSVWRDDDEDGMWWVAWSVHERGRSGRYVGRKVVWVVEWWSSSIDGVPRINTGVEFHESGGGMSTKVGKQWRYPRCGQERMAVIARFELCVVIGGTTVPLSRSVKTRGDPPTKIREWVLSWRPRRRRRNGLASLALGVCVDCI